jgi:hypothetical protein
MSSLDSLSYLLNCESGIHNTLRFEATRGAIRIYLGIRDVWFSLTDNQVEALVRSIQAKSRADLEQTTSILEGTS